MKQALVCVECFEVEFQWVSHIGAWRQPRTWWTCKECMPVKPYKPPPWA